MKSSATDQSSAGLWRKRRIAFSVNQRTIALRGARFYRRNRGKRHHFMPRSDTHPSSRRNNYFQNSLFRLHPEVEEEPKRPSPKKTECLDDPPIKIKENHRGLLCFLTEDRFRLKSFASNDLLVSPAGSVIS